MAKARKDDRGRALRKGEVQRSSDKRYMYTYTDPLGRRKFIYANDLAELREKEKKLVKDQLDGLDLYVAGKATVNDTFDRYLSTKFKLRETTRSNYIYMYDKYVRDTFVERELQISNIPMFCSFIFTCSTMRTWRSALWIISTHCCIRPFSWRFGMRLSARTLLMG